MVDRVRVRDAEATHQRLLAACVRVFNKQGYAGTDTNRLARAAGFAPATFYKHFKDKRAAFLAAHAVMLDGEWSRIGKALTQHATPQARAQAVVEVLVDVHRTWRTLRLELVALTRTDAVVKKAYQKSRAEQLDTMAQLRITLGTVARSRHEDAVLLLTLERLADALADEEAAALGLDSGPLHDVMVSALAAHLQPAADRAASPAQQAAPTAAGAKAQALPPRGQRSAAQRIVGA